MECFQLYSTVKYVQGVKYGLLIDSQRKNLFRVNGEFSKILLYVLGKTSAEIQDDEFSFELKEFIEDLQSRELGDYYEIEEIDECLKYTSYSIGDIELAIMEIEFEDYGFIKNIINQVLDLGCKCLEFRIKGKVTFNYLESVLKLFEFSIVSDVTMVFYFAEDIVEYDMECFLENFYRVHKVFVYNYYCDKEIESKTSVISYSKGIFSVNRCGTIAQKFSVNNIHINVGKNFNSCLFKMIFISSDGNVSNCHSLSLSFGNLHNTTVRWILENTLIKDIWFIKKDNVRVCSDCEYRLICTDCRAYIEDPDDILSKPLKCGYNPYTGEWSEWSTNPLKQKAIAYYGMEELVAERQERLKGEDGGS